MPSAPSLPSCHPVWLPSAPGPRGTCSGITRAELVATAEGRPLLLLVDDAHLLDDGSSMLMHQLSLSATATVVACVPTAGPAVEKFADPTVVLWKDHDATRIELSTLGDHEIDELLRRVLGGPIDAASVRLVAEYTRGDPLFVREVISGALESQALSDESGVWRVRGPLQPTSRLVELMNLRLGRLSEAERRTMELTAIGEPLAQPALDELTERAAVEALEDKGLLTSSHGRPAPPGSVWPIPSSPTSCAPASAPAASASWPEPSPRHRGRAGRRTRCSWPRCASSEAAGTLICCSPVRRRLATGATSH